MRLVIIERKPATLYESRNLWDDGFGERFGTEAEAKNSGRNKLRALGGGELCVRDPITGQIRDKDTISPAHDPRSIKG